MPSPSHVPGDCFAKCKHVPWFNTAEWAQKSKWQREQWSCKYASALPGCDKGGKPAYIDWETNDWRTCTCALPSKLEKDGSCPRKYDRVNRKWVGGWKVQ